MKVADLSTEELKNLIREAVEEKGIGVEEVAERLGLCGSGLSGRVQPRSAK